MLVKLIVRVDLLEKRYTDHLFEKVYYTMIIESTDKEK